MLRAIRANSRCEGLASGTAYKFMSALRIFLGLVIQDARGLRGDEGEGQGVSDLHRVFSVVRPICRTAHRAVFGGFGTWQTVLEALNSVHGRAGPVMSARLCASRGKHDDKDSIPFGYPVGLI